MSNDNDDKRSQRTAEQLEAMQKLLEQFRQAHGREANDAEEFTQWIEQLGPESPTVLTRDEIKGLFQQYADGVLRILKDEAARKLFRQTHGREARDDEEVAQWLRLHAGSPPLDRPIEPEVVLTRWEISAVLKELGVFPSRSPPR